MQFKVPGKLYFIGEYNVMESGHSAIVAAINKYILFSIKESDHIIIRTDLLAYSLDLKDYNQDKHPDLKFVVAALEIANQYLEECTISLKPYGISMVSELNSPEGEKYGFGSSGVVIVGVIKAVLKFHGISLDALKLFKLSVLTQKKLNDFSSGGDLAAAIYGGVINYHRYDESWLLKQEVTTIDEIISKKWPQLIIEPLNWFEELIVSVIWTKQIASSSQSIKNLNNYKKHHTKRYCVLLKEAQQIVEYGVQAIKNKNEDAFLQAVQDYQLWMKQLSNSAQLPIFIPEIVMILDDIEASGRIGKISGAGGGDCILAFSTTKKNLILNYGEQLEVKIDDKS